MRQKSIAMLERQIKTRIARLGERKQFIVGSLVESKRKCGNKKCACANGGELHSAHILTKRKNGRTKTIYIPVAMVEEVGGWSREYRRIKELIHEIDSLGEEIIATAKARKKAGIRAAKAAGDAQ